MVTTLTATVTSMERVERPAVESLVFGRQVAAAHAGWDARVEVSDAGRVSTLHFDRVDGEQGWHCSALFTPDCSMPRFMHGLFSRCTIPQMAGPSLAAMLDTVAADALAAR